MDLEQKPGRAMPMARPSRPGPWAAAPAWLSRISARSCCLEPRAVGPVLQCDYCCSPTHGRPNRDLPADRNRPAERHARCGGPSLTAGSAASEQPSSGQQEVYRRRNVTGSWFLLVRSRGPPGPAAWYVSTCRGALAVNSFSSGARIYRGGVLETPC